VTLRVTKDQIAERWEHVEHVASSLVDVAAAKSAEDVPANTRACRAFGGCPHRDYCTAGMQSGLAALIGHASAKILTAGAKDAMALITDTQAPPAGGLGAAIRAATSSDPAVKVELDALKAAEVAAKPMHPLVKIISDVESVGLGFPALAGEAAATVAAAKGLTINSGAGLAGSGYLGQYTVNESSRITQAMVAEVAQMKASGIGATAPTTSTSAVTPADAPPSDPTLASRAPGPTPEEKAATKEAEKAAKKAAKDAEKAAKQLAKEQARAAEAIASAQRAAESTVTVVNVVTDAPPVIDAAKGADEPVVTPAPVESIKVPLQMTERLTEALAPRAITLYVDCGPEFGEQPKSLWPFIDSLTARMAQEYGGDDYRTCDPNGKLGFGKWRGVLAFLIRNSEIPPGSYSLRGAQTETGGIVVEAMREVCRKSGGTVVRP
jgi:hypothetical protein